MNKKALSMVILTLTIMSLFVISCYAKNANELEEIENILSNEENFIITEASDGREGESLIDGYDMGNARKVYFSETLMLTAYEEGETVDSIISEEYQWCVPSGDSVSIFSVKEDGINLSGIRPAIGYYLSDDEIDEILLNSNIDLSKATSRKYIFSSLYYTAFNVIETDSEIYCIPYSSNDEFLGLESKKIYIFDDMMETLIKRFDESQLEKNSNSYGGVPLRETNEVWIPIVIIISAVVITVTSILLVKIRKKEKIA